MSVSAADSLMLPATSDGRSRSVATGRLLWKDAREIVPVWIAVLFAAAVSLLVTSWAVNYDSTSIAPLYISAHTLIGLCSVVTGVYLLAMENESGAVQLLRSLPVKPVRVVLLKLLLGIAGSVAVSVLIFAFTARLALSSHAHVDPGASYQFSPANVLLLPVFYFVIGGLAALLSRSFFYGLLLAAIVSIGSMVLLEPTWFGSVSESKIPWRWLGVAISAVVSIGVLLGQANHWVEEKSQLTASIRGAECETSSTRLPSREWRAWGALLWQSVRQSRAAISAYLLLTAIGWCANCCFRERALFALLWPAGMLILFSGSVFLSDQKRGNFRFFQQNVERPQLFWLSRLLPWWICAMAVVALWNLFLLDPKGLFPDARMLLEPSWIGDNLCQLGIASQVIRQSVIVPAIALLGVIGIGQLFSMFLRSSILAVIFSTVMGITFLAWVFYVVTVDENVWLHLALPVSGTYLATWIRTKYWLSDQTGIRFYAVPILIPCVLLATCMGVFVNHRANEFDDLYVYFDDPGHYVAQRADLRDEDQWVLPEFCADRQQRQRTAALYREALALSNAPANIWRGFRTWSDTQLSKCLQGNRATINMLLEAAKSDSCEPIISPSQFDEDKPVDLLSRLLMLNSYDLIENENYAEAWTSILAYQRTANRVHGSLGCWLGDAPRQDGFYGLLIYWAEQPNQNLQLIRTAIDYLESAEKPPVDANGDPAESDKGKFVVGDLRWQRTKRKRYIDFGKENVLFNLVAELDVLHGGNSFGPRTGETKESYRLFPWEWERRLKLEQRVAFNDFQWRVGGVDQLSRDNDWSFRNRGWAHVVTVRNLYDIAPVEERVGPWLRYTGAWRVFDPPLGQLRIHRYTLLRLGLAAYRIEHGEYPESLKLLSKYFQKNVPRLPEDGFEFGWFPDGIGSNWIRTHPDKPDVATEIVAGPSDPVLLPFTIDRLKDLPQPIEYSLVIDDQSKQAETIKVKGIELENRRINGFNNGFSLDRFSYFPIAPVVSKGLTSPTAEITP